MSDALRELLPGKGKLFINHGKKKDTHADYSGSIKLPDGKEYWLSMWINTSKAGGKYFTVAIGNEKQPAGAPVYSAAHKPFPAQTEHDRAKSNGYQTGTVADMDSDIPF